MSAADLFASIAAAAILLDPDEIRATIYSTHDRLPGGARSSETGIRAPRMEQCADIDCPEGAYWDDETNLWDHSHPIPNDPTGDAAMRPSRSEADLRSLSASESRFVEMVGEIAYRSLSSGYPDDWDDAVKAAHLLVEMDAVTVLEQTWGKKDVGKWVTKAGDAIHDLELVASRHLTRQPSDHERTWTSDLADEQCCRVCLELRLRVRAEARRLCTGCYQLRLDAADHLDLHADYAPDPPPELIEELRRVSPHGPDWKRARSRWITSLERDAWLTRLARQIGAA